MVKVDRNIATQPYENHEFVDSELSPFSNERAKYARTCESRRTRDSRVASFSTQDNSRDNSQTKFIDCMFTNCKRFFANRHLVSFAAIFRDVAQRSREGTSRETAAKETNRHLTAILIRTLPSKEKREEGRVRFHVYSFT